MKNVSARSGRDLVAGRVEVETDGAVDLHLELLDELRPTE